MRVLAGRHTLVTAALIATIAAVIGCASGPSTTASSSGGAPSRSRTGATPAFEREVTPFPVLDASGAAYDFPFLGGLNVPRPQFVDIDGDGDRDLFVQEHSSDLWFFENTGTPKAPRFVWRTDRFHDLEIGEWNRLADIDADGDFDILAELPYSYIRVIRNVGTATAPRFLPEADSLRNAEGEPVFADRQNIPALADIDCDGILDLFLGRVDGTIARYEATSRGSERFAFVTERFEGIEIVGQLDSVGSKHGANTMAFADWDGDGDRDLLWGDYFEPGVLLIENSGTTCGAPALGTQPRQIPGADSLRTSGFNVPAPVDLDDDGDLDFAMGVLGGAFNPILTASDNFYYWERTGPRALELRTRRFLGAIDAGSESVPAVVDIDGDDDADLVVGSKIDPVRSGAGLLLIFRNEGTAAAPRLRLTDSLVLAAAYHHAPAFADLDADGDVDLLLGTWNQDVLFYRNEGTRATPRFVQDTARTIRLPRASNTIPALADLDRDGDLDLLVGEASGEVNHLRNDGSPAEPRFELVTERLADIDVGRRSAPALVDIDGDGLLDLVVGREEQGVAAFRNVGNRSAPRFVPYDGFTLPLPPLATPVFTDLDGDGLVDIVSGSLGGGVVFLRGRPAAP